MENIKLANAKILIYGTGGNGKNFCERMHSQLQISGYIDKRANEIETLNNVSVMTLEEVSSNIKNKDEYVVVISVKNVFSHNEIAKSLLDNGFHRIVYKSDSVLKGNGDSKEKLIDEIYESLIERKECNTNYTIPYTEIIRTSFNDKLCIEKADTYVKTWCPVELLFNYKESHDYPGLNMPLFFPLVELYKYFLGDTSIGREEAVSNFMAYSCEWLKQNNRELTKSQADSFMESRTAVFEEMQKTVEVDIDFFKDNCPMVKYESGKFYLSSSGRNRVSFLIAKGFKYVPVKMSRNDYIDWCDMQYVKKIQDYVDRNKITSFFAPYPNPYLLDYPVDFVDYQRLFLIPIANSIMKKIYKYSRLIDGTLTCVNYSKVESEKSKTSVVCYMQDDGIASRYFESIGFNTSCDKKTENNYLLISSHINRTIEQLLDGKYTKIYFLNCGEGAIDNEYFARLGYTKKSRMFDTASRKGFIYAEVYEPTT
jgi:hypothetical protein